MSDLRWAAGRMRTFVSWWAGNVVSGDLSGTQWQSQQPAARQDVPVGGNHEGWASAYTLRSFDVRPAVGVSIKERNDMREQVLSLQ